MNPRLLARLELLAADREVVLLEAVRRSQEALRQGAVHRGLLAEYRERLAGSWQHGAAVSVGQARRAGQFAQASFGAEAQVEAAARQAGQHLAAAMEGLGQVQLRRRGLRREIEKCRLAAEREAEAAEAQALPWRNRRDVK